MKTDRVTLSLGALLLLVCMGLFIPLFAELAAAWRNDPQFSHGFLIPLVSLYLVWRKREKLRGLIDSSRGSSLAVVPLAVGLLAFAAGRYIGETMVGAAALIVIIASSVLFLYGRDILRATIFPMAYLLFMLPVPARVIVFLSGPLKLLVAWASAKIIAVFGIPVFLEQEFITTPSITLQVEEVCSGLRTLLAFAAIGLVYAHIFIRSGVSKTIIMVFVVFLAVLLNITRVSAIGVVAHYFGNDTGMAIHSYGWTVIDFAGFALLVLAGTGLRWAESRKG